MKVLCRCHGHGATTTMVPCRYCLFKVMSSVWFCSKTVLCARATKFSFGLIVPENLLPHLFCYCVSSHKGVLEIDSGGRGVVQKKKKTL